MKTLFALLSLPLYAYSMEPMQLYFDKADAQRANAFVLAAETMVKIAIHPQTVDPDALTAIILSNDTTLEGLFQAAPWLKEQFEYCSYPHLKLMPIFVYASSKEDPEVAFEGPVGELYEELMSGEFKPFGFDLDAKNPLEEFPRILEEYSE